MLIFNILHRFLKILIDWMLIKQILFKVNKGVLINFDTNLF